MSIRIVVCFLLCFTSVGVAFAQGQGICGGFDGGGYGPFDYRTDKDKLQIVEKHHFDVGVETLVRGKSTYRIGGDIAYTLNAFPNHHRALMAMTNLAIREKTNQPDGSGYSMECWFDRAERFRPDDHMVKMLHGLYMLRLGRHQQAIDKLEQASANDVNDANLFYNLGLAYLDLRKYDLALENAHRAYALGFPLPGLKNRLQRAGQWREAPVPEHRPEQLLGKDD